MGAIQLLVLTITAILLYTVGITAALLTFASILGCFITFNCCRWYGMYNNQREIERRYNTTQQLKMRSLS